MRIPYYYQSDVEYANKRLSATFVRLSSGGKLFYVQSVEQGDGKKHVARGLKFGAEDTLRTDAPNWGVPATLVDTSEFDMAPIELGYIFCKRLEKGVYVSRFPMRNIYKQGLHTNALSFSDGSRDYLNPSELFAPMLNSYPKLGVAATLAPKKNTTIPFARAFAVTTKSQIEYMGRQVVGHVADNNGVSVAVLDPKFSFLQQHLDWSTK
jgi:hypothetical protein